MTISISKKIRADVLRAMLASKMPAADIIEVLDALSKTDISVSRANGKRCMPGSAERQTQQFTQPSRVN